MEPALFREKVVALLGPRVEFLGPRFDGIVATLTPGVEERLFAWLEAVVVRQDLPMKPKGSRRYKGLRMAELLVFRFPFSLESGKYRVLLVKVKNAWYIEFHLGDHRYYDEISSALGLRR